LSGLVLEIQLDALNSNIPVSELLRKTLVVSQWLGDSNIEEWLNNELNGYGPDSDVPLYREVFGQVQEEHPIYGWQTLDMPQEITEILSKRKLKESVGVLESYNLAKDKKCTIYQDNVRALKEYGLCHSKPYLIIPPGQFVRILDTVRNEILGFALKLEQDGILGEGMSFSKEEKNTAAQQTYNITNNIRHMQNCQIQQHSTGPQTLNVNNEFQALTEFLSKLVSYLDSSELDEESKNELLAEVAAIQLQANSSSPKSGIIFEGLNTIRTIFEGAGGNIVANNLNINSLIEFFHRNISF